jgi:deazaflavin-dependent oxidoreductase (nitroreductase family)
MREDVRDALLIDASTPMAQRIIDITTTGRRSRQPRRLETVFYRFGDDIYLSGIPAARPRAWLLNLAADPHFTFHLKHGVVADLPATAEVIDDPDARRQILATIHTEFAERHGPDSPFPQYPLEEWLARAPLAKVTLEETY